MTQDVKTDPSSLAQPYWDNDQPLFFNTATLARFMQGTYGADALKEVQRRITAYIDIADFEVAEIWKRVLPHLHGVKTKEDTQHIVRVGPRIYVMLDRIGALCCLDGATAKEAKTDPSTIAQSSWDNDQALFFNTATLARFMRASYGSDAPSEAQRRVTAYTKITDFEVAEIWKRVLAHLHGVEIKEDTRRVLKAAKSLKVRG